MARRFAPLLSLAACLAVSGCAVPAFSSMAALADTATGVSLVSTAMTGKGTTEWAMDAVTGKDCRFEGIVRTDRDLCEEPGSEATKNDFKGLIGEYQKGTTSAPTGDTEPDETDLAFTAPGTESETAKAATAAKPESVMAREDAPGIEAAEPVPPLEPGKRSSEPYYRFLPTY